ncbi:amidase [Actinoplanes teichomyceticus]|uniref:Amidase n=1 Tax=Actinoplanes teichomyceticus TaxID=1867 RepID=A0A561VH78_ACTTI|nr:amidase family protein [Actinoplanes teichomyceticus]TWG10914.1 amidase [Actinoplanes teichomyceticus]TWG13716.1 amidase [Actinoplanes teichomyceticus]GIF12462.1 putative amidase AmiB2 [Actinoplanes teichomyceticus]
MDTTTWVGATAKQIARAVRRGDANATQVVADHLEQIAISDPALGAFRVVRGGEALTEAEKVDEQEDLANLPLAGVPVAVKENTAVAGLPTWHGSAAARTREVAEQDHEVVRRLRGAGAVVVGVTRMPEMGLWAVTDDQEGPTRNPWDLDRTPGGSSGGSAAAVAAGLVPIAQGNDGLGSIRIPAACCGLVGLKPGRGVVPVDFGDQDWFGLVENGVLTTTVADAALGFSVLAGQAPAKLVEPSRLRVAVSLRSPIAGVKPDEPNVSAVAKASKLLVDAGHDTVRADPRYPTGVALGVLATWFAGAYRNSAGLDVRGLQPRTRRHIGLGRAAMRAGLVRQAQRAAWRERSIRFFAERGVDLLLTPALAAAPPPALQYSAIPWYRNMQANARYAPYQAPWNYAGLPAIVVPVGFRPDGLPLAVQLVGPPDSELLLLSVAGQFEVLNPWQRHALV